MSKEKIIAALDVETAHEARRIVGELKTEVGAFKIGLQFFAAAGPEFVRELVRAGAKVFLDLKFHDIPNTVAKASVEAARLGVWMFDVHAQGGGEMMRRAVSEMREACEKERLTPPKIIGVTVLTSADQETLAETGIEREVPDQVIKLAKLAERSGLDGVVASPREIESTRQSVGRKDFLIVTPGIRTAAAGLKEEIYDDQKRILSPAEAIQKGADYLVVGRPILKAENPRRAVQHILAEINGLDPSAVTGV